MSIEEKYKKLRVAVLRMVGVEDDMVSLVAMRNALTPHMDDDDAAISAGVLDVLIETHGSNKTCRRCGTDDWKTISTPGGAMRQCISCDNCRWPVPGENV